MERGSYGLNNCARDAYGDDGIAGGDGEDVGAGDRLVAGLLELLLDVVNHFEPADRVLVRHRGLLAGEAWGVVEQH
jgi:hypothetical protein